jgi:hypothetical protein
MTVGGGGTTNPPRSPYPRDLPPDDGVAYLIDAQDSIIAVDGAWDTFACENGGPQLVGTAVGSSLLDCITGVELRTLWRDLLARARSGVVLTLPYRCDSPEIRRDLLLTITPHADGQLAFESVTQTAEARPPQSLLTAPTVDGAPILACGWCRRIWVCEWVEVEEAVIRLGLLETDLPPITHGLCPDCDRRVRSDAGLSPPESLNESV